jgi:hypothetical protein
MVITYLSGPIYALNANTGLVSVVQNWTRERKKPSRLFRAEPSSRRAKGRADERARFCAAFKKSRK